MMMTLIVEASHDGIRQPEATRFLVSIQLHHRRWNDIFETASCVVQRAPSFVVEVIPDAVVRRALPAGAGALEDGHQ